MQYVYLIVAAIILLIGFILKGRIKRSGERYNMGVNNYLNPYPVVAWLVMFVAILVALGVIVGHFL